MFIPVITPPPTLSPRAKELGEQIALFIMEYRQDNPDLNSMEVQQALMLARQRTNKELGGSANIKAFYVAAGFGLAMLGLLGAFGLYTYFADTPSKLMILVFPVVLLTFFVSFLVSMRIKRNQS